jgi:hypothetical protein
VGGLASIRAWRGFMEFCTSQSKRSAAGCVHRKASGPPRDVRTMYYSGLHDGVPTRRDPAMEAQDGVLARRDPALGLQDGVPAGRDPVLGLPDEVPALRDPVLAPKAALRGGSGGGGGAPGREYTTRIGPTNLDPDIPGFRDDY